VTDHDRLPAAVLLVFCAIAAGSAALGELVYLILRWAGL
jgi:hypothetical protein